MDKPSKLNERLTLFANLAVVVGIIFLALEMRQNTNMMQAQIRDSITTKQMTLTEWIGTDSAVASIFRRGNNGLELNEDERIMYDFLVNGMFREWENSQYQYRRGLYSSEEYESRRGRWQREMARPGFRDVWPRVSELFAPDFRAVIDSLAAEMEN